LLPPERDAAEIVIDPGVDDHVDVGGTIHLRDTGVERLQAVADVLAKSLVLSHYEMRFSTIFDRTEPLAARLRETGRTGAGERDLMRRIGAVLSVQHNMVGRVEAGEKPDLLWEHPELDRFYSRLADEYELRERGRVLDRKLDVIARTVETLLGLVQNRSSQRVEWYVAALIVAELVLSLYPLLLGR
jgi:required for meiotic nuclear division protein 1